MRYEYSIMLLSVKLGNYREHLYGLRQVDDRDEQLEGIWVDRVKDIEGAIKVLSFLDELEKGSDDDKAEIPRIKV